MTAPVHAAGPPRIADQRGYNSYNDHNHHGHYGISANSQFGKEPFVTADHPQFDKFRLFYRDKALHFDQHMTREKFEHQTQRLHNLKRKIKNVKHKLSNEHLTQHQEKQLKERLKELEVYEDRTEWKLKVLKRRLHYFNTGGPQGAPGFKPDSAGNGHHGGGYGNTVNINIYIQIMYWKYIQQMFNYYAITTHTGSTKQRVGKMKVRLEHPVNGCFFSSLPLKPITPALAR
ncbi:hypothetical protein CS022_13135 [Veronia nyctiphanis]|uniref:Uncharacterized protein n=1 Tax=Veronia nyctiphanis TaxID=1278244 RepID=A0A4Q0YRR2_9GAMM|nr:hypothetical protein [Veronia nyctiphanis]RXJ72804.1 hypothetical protein CS022_13135 [Veronia nyctiphanis]